jgi:hypothetical protein
MLDDVWRICGGSQGYRWQRIAPGGDDPPVIRRGPLVHDPVLDRYVVVGGMSNAGGLFPHEDAFFLLPGAAREDWRWAEQRALPSTFGGRHSHLAYFDPQLSATIVGLGYVRPFSEASTLWAYRSGQWSVLGEVPDALRGRQGFGFDHDPARRELVLWGDNDSPFFDTSAWFLSGTATSTAIRWRSADLDAPVPRAWPTLVHDRAREATVVFGGRRFDGRFVPPEIYSMITQPAWPQLLATIDLASARPRGIERLELVVRGAARGDADGVGPSTTAGGGFAVLLWDHDAKRWEPLGASERASGAPPVNVTIEVRERPERFVGPDGTVPVLLRGLAPATEALDAELAVDRLDGALYLRPGVNLD